LFRLPFDSPPKLLEDSDESGHKRFTIETCRTNLNLVYICPI